MSNLFNETDFNFFNTLILEAGSIAHDIQKKGMEITRKSDTSIVTQADMMVQELLIDRIQKKYPDINFICEEKSDKTSSKITDDTISAIIDPIDGTAVYSMHLPMWCVSVGIYRGYNPLYGFVYSPGCGMLFYNDNENSYLNKNIIKVNKNMIIDSETNIFYASEIQRIFFIDFPGKVRNFGSTALQACLTADNKRNRSLVFVGKSYIWDWAGAIPIIIKANGNMRYISDKKIDFKEIIHNNYHLTDFLLVYNHDDFDLVKNIFRKL